jgi:hypothetical protein
MKVIAIGINKAAETEIWFLMPGRTLLMAFDQCAVNVPQGLQSREFFEAFEGTSEPSVRAFVVGKRLIHLGGRHFPR